MSDDIMTLPQLRSQLELAQTLAKSRVAFVVMPVLNKDALRVDVFKQQSALEELAQAAEREQRGGD